jgi:hypothetical protein
MWLVLHATSTPPICADMGGCLRLVVWRDLAQSAKR